MKLSLHSFLLLLTGILTVSRHSFGQDTKGVNESVFAEVKKFINEQKDDSLYALLNDDFKAKFSKEAFAGVLKNNLYPYGAVKESALLSYKDGTSCYKTVFNKGILEFRIATDKTGKIAGLRFLPYKEAESRKNEKAISTNTLNTLLDKQIDTIARDYIDTKNTTGLAIGILKNDVVTYYGYGETEKGNGKIPGPDVIFELGSVTKTFTATLLAYYTLADKIALSDPITKYLPDSVAANKELQKITVKMLANHTSGLFRMPDNMFDKGVDMLNPYKGYDEKKLFVYLKDCKLQYPAGTQYEYSNLAAGLLGVILERISGKSYEQMIEDVICKPLGMASTIQHPNAVQKEREVTVYDDKGNAKIMWDIDALASAGALRSTINDMLKYLQANASADKSPLSKAMQLTHTKTYEINKEMSIGLGWHISELSGTQYYWHNGATGGSRSYVAFVPGKDIAVVVLSNAAEDVDAVGNGILKVLQ